MASKKKTEKIEKPEIIENQEETITNDTPKIEEQPKTEQPKIEKVNKKNEKEPKFKIGSIVFVSKDAEADLNGFKLFPQYKKYTYTVEAYDAISGVYTLRRLNLSLKLKEAFILAPDEKAHDSLNRRQF